MAQIDGELKHGETVAHDVLSESGVFFSFLLGFGWKVEQHEDPHNSVFVESFVHGALDGVENRGVLNRWVADFAQCSFEAFVECGGGLCHCEH